MISPPLLPLSSLVFKMSTCFICICGSRVQAFYIYARIARLFGDPLIAGKDINKTQYEKSVAVHFV